MCKRAAGVPPYGHRVSDAPATRMQLQPRPVYPSLEEMLDAFRARDRQPFSTAERRSNSRFERVTIDGRPHVVKHLHLDDDFSMRASGDIGCRPLRAWQAGLYDTAPTAIDHAVVAMAGREGRNGWGATVLLRDVSHALVPPGDDPLPAEQHDRFVDHLAALCASTWQWSDDLDLLEPSVRWSFFGPAAIAGERTLGWPEPVPEIAERGWQSFAERAPGDVASSIRSLRHDVAPLVRGLATTPWCFLHGDWKASNLGTGDDGRTILLDWVYLGAGPACHELGWYLALNRSKLPRGRSKEDVIAEFEAGLRRHGVDTSGWWDRQVGLALLGTVVQFGWEKALGDATELGWWCDRVRDGLRLL